MTESAIDNVGIPLEHYNLFLSDPVLPAAIKREGGDIVLLTKFGGQVGTEEIFEWGRLANRNSPILHTHDRFGTRIDEVEYHPAYHSLLKMSVENGIHSMRYEQDPG